LRVGDYEEEFGQCHDDCKIEPPSGPDVGEILLERPRNLDRQLDSSFGFQLFDQGKKFLIFNVDVLLIQGFLERSEIRGTMLFDNLDELFSR